MKVYLKNPGETEKLGKKLAALLKDGDVVCLTGDLGAGKTHLCRSLAAALGVNPQEVTSPTFTIMNMYEGGMEIRHFDFYRLERAEELEDIGFGEYCGGSGLTLIEWAEMFSESLPEDYLQIALYREGEGRRAEISARGQGYERIVEGLENDCFGN